jgi:hypothetical protein
MLATMNGSMYHKDLTGTCCILRTGYFKVFVGNKSSKLDTRVELLAMFIKNLGYLIFTSLITQLQL